MWHSCTGVAALFTRTNINTGEHQTEDLGAELPLAVTAAKKGAAKLPGYH